MEEQKDLLSERELEILRLVATGAANKEIARQLLISPNTVKVHMRNIFAKIGVASRTEATLYAIHIGLVKPGQAGVENSAGQPDDLDLQSTPELPEADLAPMIEAPLPRSRWFQTFWKLGGVVLLAVLLIAGVVAGARSFVQSPQPTPVVAAQMLNTAISTQRWSEKAALPLARKGMGFAEYNDSFYLIGGESSQGIDGALLRYQPDQNTWEVLKNKPTPVTDIQAALLGEKIYVPGGRLANGDPTGVLEIYDPRHDTWEHKAPLPVPLSAYALATFEGQVYLFGGTNGVDYTATVYSYDPQEDRWQERSALDQPRAYAGTAVLNGKILVIGGRDGAHALRLNQAYYPNRDAAGEPAWENLSPLPGERYAMGVTQLGGFIFLIGGKEEGGGFAETTLQYISTSDQWTALENPPRPAGAHSALLASGNFIYLFGGESPTGLLSSNQSFQAIYTISVPILNN